MTSRSMSVFLYCVLLVFVECLGFSPQVEGKFDIHLTGEWNLSDSQHDFNIQGNVPGDMYMALYQNKKISDPFYGYNDIHYRWAALENWTYTRQFTVENSFLKLQKIVLVCDGLDTISTVYINGQTVGSSNNMFVRYIYDVKKFLKQGTNEIEIAFQSAVEFAEKAFTNHSYVIPPKCPPDVQHGNCHVNMIRKEQCSFSWDWGPSFPTQGIWRNILIEGFNTAVIRNVAASTTKASTGLYRLDVDVFFEIQSNAIVNATVGLNFADGAIVEKKLVTLSPKILSVHFEISIPKNFTIHEWWPNGYGEQKLYNLSVSVQSGNEVDSRQIKIGFKTVELIQQPVSNITMQGLSFYFKINGLPIFLKGSNWIPADSFQERVTLDVVRNLLKSAADVHINSLRVWGGGVYESDEFYNLADELGILIWQDFMFGCAMYPTDQGFLDSVKEEITYQVRRLKHHPSILLWSGNNENEKALRQSWYDTDVNYTRYYNDYIKLYIDTIKPIVEKEDSSRPYIASSPTDGALTAKQGWVANDPASEFYGDIHYYNYYGDLWKDSAFRIPRLASEYGIQAWCSFESVEKVFPDRELSYTSQLSQYRQHHELGNTEMLIEAMMNLHYSMEELGRKKFEDLIYITQINQAMSIRTETEHYRRWQSQINPEDGRGVTMGALYWQLNDIWQAPTWSSIEYGGKWKMLHYYAQHFFAPTLISPFEDTESVNIFLVIDEVKIKEIRNSPGNQLMFVPLELKKHTLCIQMYSWDNMSPIFTWNITTQINSTAESVFKKSKTALLNESGCIDSKNCFLFMYLDDPSLGINSWLPLSRIKEATRLQKATLQVSDVKSLSNTTFNITLGTDHISLFVWLEAYGIRGRFSDNGFLMLQRTRSITFTAWQPTDIHTLKSSLKVKSLTDVP